jgi:hypothetical protein
MNTPNDTQKIKAELIAELRQTESKLQETSGAEQTIEVMSRIRWLRKKINFLLSPWHHEYKATNARLDQAQ